MKHVRVDLHAMHGRQVSEPQLLHEFVERQVTLRPQKMAVKCHDNVMSYRDLDDAANRIASILRGRGVRAGSLVGLYMTKSCQLIAGMLGILKAGAGYVPIDPRFPIGRIQSILSDAAVEVVLSEETLGTALQPHIAAEIVFAGEEASTDIDLTNAVGVTPNDVCYVIYTSGSTGEPKGVVIEHRNVANFLRAIPRVYKIGHQDRVYQGFSVAFDASVEEIWGALSVGATLIVPSEDIARSSIDAADLIASEGVTFFSTVPSFLATIKLDLPSVRLLVLGGEVCPPELVNRWATAGRRMLNTYGPTEATVVATYAECSAGDPVTIGTPLPGYETFILDEHFQPVTPGECGELYIGGESVARGYMNRPDLTAERFIRNPQAMEDSNQRLYRTSDVVRTTESGQIQFIGRVDSQVKIRGFRVELSEIEAILMEHPQIRVASVDISSLHGESEIAAYIVAEPDGAELNRASIRDLLRRRVPDYMVPKYLDVLDVLPTMTSGKVDKKALPQAKALLTRANRKVVAPISELEGTVANVCSHILHISPLSVEDDFFLDLHAHSLNIGKIVGELRENLGTSRLGVRDLYSHRTARSLAQYLEDIGVVHRHPDTAGVDAPMERSSTKGQQSQTGVQWLCVGLQCVALAVFYGLVSAPLVFSVDTVIQTLGGRIDWSEAALRLSILGVLIWPSAIVLSIVVKWVFIGRFKAGRYRVWGLYYFRWWLVSRFHDLSLSWVFAGTPLMSLYYRAMGAKVGSSCTIGTPFCTAYDLVSVGDNTSIGADTHLFGYRVEDGWLILDRVTIGRECYVGMHCYLGLGVTLQDRGQVEHLSLVPDRSVVCSGENWQGSPAIVTGAKIVSPGCKVASKAVWFGFAHLAIIYGIGLLYFISAVPFLWLVGYALKAGGVSAGVAVAFASIPLSILWHLLVVIFTKWIFIGRVRAGIYPVHSGAYLRYWTMNIIMNGTKICVLPLYATLFYPSFLRALGAKVGRKVEISTIMHAMPDLLEIGDRSFLADACIVGACRIHDGVFELSNNKIGSRTFIGNSALIPAGIHIGDNCLIGVMSTPPAGVLMVPDGTRWLGSPAFQLPSTQQFCGFNAKETFEPTFGLICCRASIDLLRILLPYYVIVGSFIAFCGALVYSHHALTLWGAFLLAPAIAGVLSASAVLLSTLLKTIFIGRFKPAVKPLWCRYVWFNEVVNGLYETVVAPILSTLLGTPLASPVLRLMGCKVGRWAFIETTSFSEFDLVTIGDRAALNQGSTIQTHLFEDRVMKSDNIRIESGCSVGSMAVVLYDTHMRPGSSIGSLSVLMKGESLPANSCWQGIPTQPLDANGWSRKPAELTGDPIARRPQRGKSNLRTGQSSKFNRAPRRQRGARRSMQGKI